MSIRLRRRVVIRAAASACLIAGTATADAQTIVLNGAALVLDSIDQLGPAVLAVDNGTLALGLDTFAKPPFAGPYFRNAIVTSGAGLILGDGRSFTHMAGLSGAGGVSVVPSAGRRR